MATSTVSARASSAAVAHLTNSFRSRIVVCVVLSALDVFVVAEFAGALYQATSHHKLQQIGLTLLFAALLGSLARTWVLTLSDRSH